MEVTEREGRAAGEARTGRRRWPSEYRETPGVGEPGGMREADWGHGGAARYATTLRSLPHGVRFAVRVRAETAAGQGPWAAAAVQIGKQMAAVAPVQVPASALGPGACSVALLGTPRSAVGPGRGRC